MPRVIPPLVPVSVCVLSRRPPGRPGYHGCYDNSIEHSIHTSIPTPRQGKPPSLTRLRQGSAISILPPADYSVYYSHWKIVDFATKVLLPRPSEALWEKTGPIGSPRPLVGRLPAFPVSRLVFFLIR